MLRWRTSLLIFAVAIACAAAFNPVAHAATETVIHSFPDGANPVPPLMQRANGTLIGIAHNAGFGYGAVFRLSEQNGAWKEKELYRFTGDEGAYPSNVIEHKDMLYGMTAEGGFYGAGTAFSLTRAGKSWTESVLYSFTGGRDGSNPDTGLLWEKPAGAFFGVTPANISAPPNCGTVFSITPEGTEDTIHRFKGDTDGCWPDAELHELHTGKGLTLVGTTVSGGEGNDGLGYGTVFVVTERNGRWHESVIYRFTDGDDGAFPGDVLVDSGGNIIGVASGGSHGQGVVFELGRSGGQWMEKTIYAFAGGADGEDPVGLCRDSATGNLYGVTTYGGAYSQGTVFQLFPSNGSWTESVLHSFGATGDGQYPEARPIYDAEAGVLYGTTRYGGEFNGGVVYAISLSGSWRHLPVSVLNKHRAQVVRESSPQHYRSSA